jgi:phospholipid-binding lipoprotein MlaA
MKRATLMRWLLAASAALLLSACAATPGAGADPRDPFEKYNRAMFEFNNTLDRNVIKPAAEGYLDYVPEFMRTAISNFFGNIGDVWTAVNNYLQLKPREGTQDVARVVLNSTFGLAGLIDVATPAGLPKHEEDFGQTLGTWGVRSGPYFVLPIFGSSTVRDGFAKPIDLYADALNQIPGSGTRNSARVLRAVDDRADLLGASSLLEDAALDPYQFIRDAYLQRRASRVRDGGDPPKD